MTRHGARSVLRFVVLLATALCIAGLLGPTLVWNPDPWRYLAVQLDKATLQVEFWRTSRSDTVTGFHTPYGSRQVSLAGFTLGSELVRTETCWALTDEAVRRHVRMRNLWQFSTDRPDSWLRLTFFGRCRVFLVRGTHVAHSATRLVCPLWPWPLLFAAHWSVVLVRGACRYRRRRRQGLCLHCGYSLTGNVSGVCPECGRAVPVPSGERDGEPDTGESR